MILHSPPIPGSIQRHRYSFATQLLKSDCMFNGSHPEKKNIPANFPITIRNRRFFNRHSRIHTWNPCLISHTTAEYVTETRKKSIKSWDVRLQKAPNRQQSIGERWGAARKIILLHTKFNIDISHTATSAPVTFFFPDCRFLPFASPSGNLKWLSAVFVRAPLRGRAMRCCFLLLYILLIEARTCMGGEPARELVPCFLPYLAWGRTCRAFVEVWCHLKCGGWWSKNSLSG